MTVPKAFEKAFRNDPTTPGRVVYVGVYTRVSGDKQVKFGGSFTDQKARAPDYVKQIQPNGQMWQIYEFYEEGGITGHTEKRPQLQRLMTDARNGKIGIVLIPMVDRLWRELRLLLNYTHELKELGIEIISMDGLLDTRHPDYQTSLTVMGLLAEREWTVRSERAKYAVDRCKKNHEWGHGRPPYGYRFDRTKKTTETDHLIIYEDEAGVIRLIFKWYTLENIGGLQIAERLNNMHIAPPPCPKRIKFIGWQTASIFEILHHHCYKGGYKDGQGIDPLCDYRCPAIVDTETWEKAQTVCDDKKHIDLFVEPKSEFGNGRCHCGLCGGGIRLQENGNGTFSYECVGRRKNSHPDSSPRCILPRMKWKQFDQTIHKKLNEKCGTKEQFIAELRNNQAQLEAEARTLKSHQKPIADEIAKIDNKKTMLVKLAKHMSITPEEFDDEMTKLTDARAKLIATPDEKRNLEHAKTLWQEVEDIRQKIYEYDVFIEDVQKLDWDDLKRGTVIKDTQKRDGAYAQLITDYHNFNKIDNYDFIIMPNPDNPEDRENPDVFLRPKDKKYPWVIVGEAKLKRQNHSPSACSR